MDELDDRGEEPEFEEPEFEEPRLQKGWHYLVAVGVVLVWSIGYVVVSEVWGTGSLEWNSSESLVAYCLISVPFGLVGLAGFLFGFGKVGGFVWSSVRGLFARR